MSNFEPGSIKIKDFLNDIETGKLRLPCFQRSYKWNPPRVKALMNSLQHEYPAGSLLFLKVGRDRQLIPDEPFKYTRAEDFTKEAEYLVLDGQQRITSCYYAFTNPAQAYYTYYLDYYKMMQIAASGPDPSYDFEELIVNKRHSSTPFTEIAKGLFPMSYLRNRKTMGDQIQIFIDGIKDDESFQNRDAIIRFLNNDFKNIVEPILDYEFPVVKLSDDLTMEAICKVFQTINTTGLKLSVFDICTAVFFPQNINLKDMVHQASNNHLYAKIVLEKDETLALQVVALLANKKPNTNKLADELTASDITDYWDDAINGIEEALILLDTFGAGTKKNLSILPYTPIIPVVAAILARKRFGTLPADQAALISNKLKTFFYYVSLSSRYTEGTNNKIKEDYDNLLTWLAPNGTAPSMLGHGVDWNTEKLIESNKGSAFGKAILCLINSKQPKDFYNDKSVGVGEHVSESCDLHHLFPKATYESLYPEIINSVFNYTWLTKDTNVFITDKSTIKYIDEIYSSCGITESALKNKLADHFIDSEVYKMMYEEKYESFLKARAQIIKAQFEAIGVSFNDVDSDEIDMEEIEEDEET